MQIILKIWLKPKYYAKHISLSAGNLSLSYFRKCISRSLSFSKLSRGAFSREAYLSLISRSLSYFLNLISNN